MTETPAPPIPALRDRLIREARMLIPFGVVGTCGFLLDATLLKIGLALGLSKAIARVFSILISMHFAFAMNRMWAFKALRGAPLVQQWLGYLVANSAGALLNYAVFLVLSHQGMLFEHAPILAVAAGSIAGMFVNFFGSRLLAFRH
jgi:putative flippase GtrA